VCTRLCRDDGVIGVLQYSTDLFDKATMDRMAQHLSNLLAAVTVQPAARLSSLGFLSVEEEQLVLHTFNDTAGTPPTMCVHQYFERQAAAMPQNTCLIDSTTGSSLTYSEVNCAANRLARHLIGAGIAADIPVAVLMDKCFEAYIALVAVLKAGGEPLAVAAACNCIFHCT
jgi:non-ribosomal peptide synthetase component F